MKFRFVRTCYACPEQYDAYLGEDEVAYLRLRHGVFTVDVPFGNTVATFYPMGDGMFEGDERDKFLRLAAGAIKESLENRPTPDGDYWVEE